MVLSQLNMLPMGFLVVLSGVSAIFWLIPLIGHVVSRKRAIAVKVVSVLMILILFTGIYFAQQFGSALRGFSGDGRTTMIDNVVVAVLVDDPAESLEDARHYTFGVQYVSEGESIREAIDEINATLGTTVVEREYGGLFEQIEGLLAGEVQAIIYNEAFQTVLDEIRPEFLDEIRVIAVIQTVTELDSAAVDIEIADESFAVFISGIDVFGAIETNGLSDVNMLMVVNPVTHQILLINTPRDYYIPFPGITGGQRDKLTHAGIYGVHASMDALSALYGVDVPFYVRVNFTSFIDIIDALDGIDVYSQRAFTTSLGMPVSQGINRFNGTQALEFSRERFNVVGGDIGRGANQQAVITAILRRAMSPAILRGANSILNSVETGMDTNMSYEQIQTLIRNQLSDSPAWNIKSMGVDGEFSMSTECFSMPGWELFVILPDQASIDLAKEQIAALQRGEILEDAELLQ